MRTKKTTKPIKKTNQPRTTKLIDAIGADELDGVIGGASVPYGHLATSQSLASNGGDFGGGGGEA
jgi:hypothetical protein